MNVFSFIKEAGEKVSDFITGNGKTEDAIKSRIEQLDLAISNLTVDVRGDKATLQGVAASNDDREKAILAAGNIEGIAEVDAQLTVQQQKQQTAINQSNTSMQAGGQAGQQVEGSYDQQPTFYQVKTGDTLSKIARQFYDDANRYDDIFQANRPMLSDPDKIYPGQTLRIPNAHQQQQAA